MLFQEITGKIIDAGMTVHTALGAGLFEEVYHACLRHELLKRELKVLSQVGLPVTYDGVRLENGYKIDLLVEDSIIVELKSVEHLAPVHKAQLLTYLKLANIQVGLLLNFNVPHFSDGICRVANTFPSPRPLRTPRTPR